MNQLLLLARLSGRLLLATCMLLSLLLARPGTAQAQALSQLQANGPKIVDANGQEIILKGMGLGGWMLQEGYMMKPGFGGTQGYVKRLLFNAGQTNAQVEAFYQGWRDNFITKADIDYLAAKGFNCVRLPLHYELFLTARQRAVRVSVSKGTVPYSAYVDSLNTWYTKNQLFTDPSSLEGIRLVNEVLSWCGGNRMYVVLDLHAAPGAQGSDTNIADALLPGGNDFWNNPLNQNVANRLWQMLATRYLTDPRIAMYDVLNEPNNVPGGNGQNGNQRVHDAMQRFINTIRAVGDQHLIMLEGNGYGNDYNWMEKRTFTNTANLVYNSHRYSGAGYPLDNGVNSTEGNVNGLRFIGNLTRFRTDNNVPIWVGETGENTPQWMGEAAQALNSVGIGWCHWTLKRFDDNDNAAFFHIVPPYVVDAVSSLGPALENVKFARCVPNNGVINAVAPTPGNPVRDATPPVGRTITLQSVSTGKYVSGEGGTKAMTATHATAGASEQFEVLDAGNGKVYLRSQGKYVSSENGQQSLSCNRTTPGYWEAFDWFVNADGSISLGGFNGQYVTSGGQYPMSCSRVGLTSTEAFTYATAGALATKGAAGIAASAYPNPVRDRLTYALPAGTRAHQLTLLDTAGRTILTRSYGNVGAQNTLDTSVLARGLYLLRLTGDDFVQSFKLVKE